LSVIQIELFYLDQMGVWYPKEWNTK